MTSLGVTVTSAPEISKLPDRHTAAYQAMLGYIRQTMSDEGPRYLGIAQDEAPKRTGEFAQGMRQESFNTPTGGGFKVSLPAPLGRWIIDGTPAHVIAAHGRALRFVWGGETVFFRSVNHPGTKPNDFIRRAYGIWEPEAKNKLRGVAALYAQVFTGGR